tara:strand:+ start:4489 stop:4956 length:468 start_codon:yes stop_codon:yes gene_type:complete
MYRKKNILSEEILNKMRKYCAFQERCVEDVKKKLDLYVISKNKKIEIISSLTAEKYIDEKRFSSSYCQGKFKIKKWGKQKIKNELIKKKISRKNIEIAINSISMADYIKTLNDLIDYKIKYIKDEDLFNRNGKLVRFLLQRGYEFDIIWDQINTK